MGMYQSVEEGSVSAQSLSSFAVEWFRNIKSQGFHKAEEQILYNGDEIRIEYDTQGLVVDISGDKEDVAKYIEENNIEIHQDNSPKGIAKELSAFIYDYDYFEFLDTLEVGESFDDAVETLAHEIAKPDGVKIILESVRNIHSQMEEDDEYRERAETIIAHLEGLMPEEETIVPEFEKAKPVKVANTIVYPEIPLMNRTNFVII